MSSTAAKNRRSGVKDATAIGTSTSDYDFDVAHPLQSTNQNPIEQQRIQRQFLNIYIVTQVLGLTILGLIILWTFAHLGGYGLSVPLTLFNFHPLFQSFGFVFIYSNAMLIYRFLHYKEKPWLKTMHAILMGVTIFVCSLGSLSAYSFHSQASIPHFYSLHSWLGISTFSLFLVQFVSGFVIYLTPGASLKIRSFWMEYHRFLGMTIFGLACATSALGLNEKAIFSLKKDPAYSELPAAGVMINLIGVLMAVYATLTLFLVVTPKYARKETGVESHLLARSPISSSSSMEN